MRSIEWCHISNDLELPLTYYFNATELLQMPSTYYVRSFRAICLR